MSGFDVARFYDDPDEDMRCSICHGVLNNPLMLPKPCEHLFCCHCIVQWFRTQSSNSSTGTSNQNDAPDFAHSNMNQSNSNNNNNSAGTRVARRCSSDVEGVCPECRNSAKLSQLMEPPRFVLNRINRLRLRCSFAPQGCELSNLTIENVDVHEKGCGFGPAVCPNQGCRFAMHTPEGTPGNCADAANHKGTEMPPHMHTTLPANTHVQTATLLRQQLAQHVAEQCEFRTTSCPNTGCKEHILAKDLKDHRVRCAFEQIACERGCGINHSRSATAQHTVTCGKVMITCSVEGCKFEAPRDDCVAWDQHMTEQCKSHMQILFSRIGQLENTVRGQSALMGTVTNLQARVKHLEATVADQRTTISALQLLATQKQLEMPSVFCESEVWTVSGIRARWNEGFVDFSPELKFSSAAPNLRYSFLLQIDVNNNVSKDHIGVFFVPRRGENHTQLEWPMTQHLRLKVLGVKNSHPRMFTLCDPGVQQWLKLQSPPLEQNTDSRGYPRFVSTANLNDYVDDEDRLCVQLQLLNRRFLTGAEEKAVIIQANAMGATWLVHHARTAWTEQVIEYSPELVLENSNRSLRYTFMLRVQMNVLGSRNHVGIFFIPRRGEDPTHLRWPIENQIRVSILNLRGGEEKIFTLSRAFLRKWYATHSPPQAENVDSQGTAKFLTKKEFDSEDFVDAADRLFIRVELLDQLLE